MALYSFSLISSISPAKTPCLKLNRLILPTPFPLPNPSRPTQSLSSATLSLRATPHQQYVYPDPIPEFAQSETRKFKIEFKKTLEKDIGAFGEELDNVVDVCAKLLHEFLSNEYGGPGTLLVEPFTYMLIALKDNSLPGAVLAARASLLCTLIMIGKFGTPTQAPGKSSLLNFFTLFVLILSPLL